MDDLVLAALKKWPNVPDCRGWLGLDARGDWYMRDARTQAAGPFPQSRGSRVDHDKLRDFIDRNLGVDAQGQHFFQNGPQRVYLELEAAPCVWRVEPGVDTGSCAAPGVRARGAPAVQPVTSTWLDEHGRLFAQAANGRFGLVHTLDMGPAADALEAGLWPEPAELAFAELPARFGYVLSPAACGGASPV